MGSMSQVIPLPQTIVEIEILAALKALEFAADLGLISMVLEGDLEILMNALMDNSLSLASFGLFIPNIKAYAEFFRCTSFSHVRREGNIVAHNLARHACHVTSFSMWMEDVASHTLLIRLICLLLNKITYFFLKEKKKKKLASRNFLSLASVWIS